MPQAPFTIANQPGAGFRAAINLALNALETNSSGPTEPAAPSAFMWWADTTTGILKQRNAGNNAWVSVFSLATGAPVAGVSETSVTGAVLLPEGNDTQRPTPIPPGRMLLRGSTQDPTDYKIEFWNPVASAWHYLASRVWVRRQLAARPQIRQTVTAGPVDTSGYPSFLPATSAGLSISTQNLTTGAPLIVTAAGGFDVDGQVDRTGSSASLTWSGLAASARNFLYVDISVDGVLTPGATTRAPVYQFGGAAGATSGQLTFNTSEMVCRVGNGAAADRVFRVFVGEATTSGTAVTDARAYAYNGKYVRLGVALAASMTTSVAHNIGVSDVAGHYTGINTASGGRAYRSFSQSYDSTSRSLHVVYTSSTNALLTCMPGADFVSVYANASLTGVAVDRADVYLNRGW